MAGDGLIGISEEVVGGFLHIPCLLKVALSEEFSIQEGAFFLVCSRELRGSVVPLRRTWPFVVVLGPFYSLAGKPNHERVTL